MTEFNTEIAKAYSSKEVEEKWSKRWLENKCFHADDQSNGKPVFSMVIPPPNVTGILHMGHALNDTLQDIIARHKRLLGYDVLWMPGTDHAGIATQNVVEKSLLKEGLRRQDLGRDKFIDRVWQWREECGSTIIEQLKRLGCSCDWDRIRFTMDEGLSNAVQEVFIRLYDKGLIYRSNYIINWCPRCQTALSDEESAHQEISGAFYHIRYDIKDTGQSVVIATTRPETLLGDTAIGFNPNDERFLDFHGKTAVLPLLGRDLKIILDEKIDMETGTGALKITPAHDPVDFELGRTHNLSSVNILNKDGSLNENAGPYQGMDRFAARKKILEDLKAEGRLVKVVDHTHSVGHCYRCDTLVEPYCSDQWFVKMKPLAEPAIESVESGAVKFYPERWSKTYMEWMTNIRDWCISRQIWWGHRIPVYYADDGRYTAAKTPDEARQKLGLKNGENLRQDNDVLDTWFSSWLWPFSTMSWPEDSDLLQKYYPTTSLVTGYEIIFFWVARMMMAGHEFMGQAPFKDIYIHGIVRDKTGAKMSKSKGNVLDPLEIIDEFGADALRFSIVSITSEGQDVFAAKERFEIGRNFANKIWNASRFTITNLRNGGGNENDPSADLVNKWIKSRLAKAIQKIDNALSQYRFNEATSVLYDFFWSDFCDWYLELTKGLTDKQGTIETLEEVLTASLKLLNPFMPFITEEIWELLHEGKNTAYLMHESWPTAAEGEINPEVESAFEEMILLIQATRNIRATWKISPSQKLDMVINAASDKEQGLIRLISPLLKKMARLENLSVGIGLERPAQSVTATIGKIESYIPLQGIIDISGEVDRLQSSVDDLQKHIDAASQKLSNPAFTDKAPAQVIEKHKSKLDEMLTKRSRLEENIKLLSH